VPPVPTVHSGGAAFSAAADTFFAPVQPEPVPEIFDPPSARDVAPAPSAPALEELRTQVPPGFERRTFAPMPEEPPPPPPPPSGNGWGLLNAPDGPIGAESPPSALLGVVPPPSWSAASPSPVAPPPVAPSSFAPPPVAPPPPAPPSLASPSLAPPEPAPWVDPGWVDFGDLGSRGGGHGGDLGSRGGRHGGDFGSRGGEPEPALVGAGVGLGSAPAGVRVPLPRRVPRVPDLDFPLFESDPAEPEPDPATEHHELNRIADYLRDEAEAPSLGERPDAVDLESVLSAVRQVPEVRDAQLRWNAQSGHTLRIEFVDGVDESEITRSVVRLLRAKLGLEAQPSVEASTVDSPFRGRVSAVRSPSVAAAPVGGGRTLPRPSGVDVPRLVMENVTMTRLGAEATVEVRLRGPGGTAVGEARGPGVDAYLSRVAATAAAHAVDQALGSGIRGKVFVEHVSVVPFGVAEVAVVVLLLSYNGVTEQLSGSAIVVDDPHQAVVRATLAALNRRLESLLA
jgi:hypothetical protein